LSVHFGVNVYGAPINDGIQAAIILSIIFGLAGALATSYYVRRGVHSKSPDAGITGALTRKR
jgi:hypothetical protein